MKVVFYCTPKEISALVMELKEWQISEKDIAKTLSWVVSSLKSGHSGPAPKEADAIAERY